VEDTQKSAVEEADVAGGRSTQSVLKRVSSFSIMSRLPSQTQLSISSSASLLSLGDAANKSLNNNTSDSNLSTDNTANDDRSDGSLKPSWRLRDRMKTVGVGLVMALNVGTDPPDIIKPHPCAKLQCWMDPSSVTRAKAKEKIGERLEAQYIRWQQQRAARPLKYRRALDPTVEDVRALCLWLRRQARHERILLHYNGHGVPRPTSNGEIWVFDKNHTEYIPLSVSDLRQWTGKPTIVVLDCSSAGILIPFLTCPVTETPPNTPPQQPVPPPEETRNIDMETAASHWVKDTIVLCPTSDQEWLPMHPDYPADIFTSCLTTPIQIALRWFVRRNKHSMGLLNPEAVDAIPGHANDRKTPLGELNWIFTAVTDSIAWNVLPKPLFQRLFRQDLLVASMFRNFLLADRILRSLNCTPQSYPPLPPGVADHPLWQAWDLACETCLFGLLKDGILGNHVVKPPATTTATTIATNSQEKEGAITKNTGNTNNATDRQASSPPPATPLPTPPTTGPASSISSPFFSEQLSAFEVWLEYAAIHKDRIEELESPEQLPVVLQVLLSQVHRIRALELLRRFLELGPWAINLSLSLGIFPYVMKLLQSPEYKSLLVDIWASILKFDPSCQVDLVKDGALPHFIQPLTSWSHQNPLESAKQRTLAAYSVAATCHKYPLAQTECLRQNLHGHCRALLTTYLKLKQKIEEQGDESLNSQLMSPTNREWLCVCIGNMVRAFPPTQQEAFNSNTHVCLISRLEDDASNVRAASAFALGCLLEYAPDLPPPMNLGPQGLASPTFQSPPGAHTFSGQPILVPQHISATTMTVPAALTASAVLSGRLQAPPGNPTLGGIQPTNTGVWHPSQIQQPPIQQPLAPQLSQPIQPMPRPQHPQKQQPLGGQLQPSQQAPTIDRLTATAQGLRLGSQAIGPGIPLMPQQSFLRLQGAGGLGSMIGGPKMMTPGTPIDNPLMRSPLGVSMGSSHSLLMNPIPPIEQQQPRRRATVYEDRRRREFDLTVAEALCKALDDGSSVVRYEAIMALCNFVEKYIKGFLVVAEENSFFSTSEEQDKSHEEQCNKAAVTPQGLNRSTLDRFTACWKLLKSVHHKETHPSIAQAASRLVSVVHAELLDLTVEKEMERKEKDDKKDGLSGIDEEGVGVELERTKSDRHLTNFSSQMPEAPRSDGPQHRLPGTSRYPPRRPSLDNFASRSDVSRVAFHSPQGFPTLSDAFGTARASKKGKKEFSLPKSKFYEWKLDTFKSNIDASEEDDIEDLDPLNPAGVVRAYQGRRNSTVHETGHKLAVHFERLKPKPKKNTLLDSDEEADEVDSSLKVELKLREKRLLRNPGSKMTSMLKFHSYENVLMICDDQDGISFCDYEKGVRSLSYKNGNPNGSRMTTAFWINESSTSLFFVGCDDGSVRIWDGIVESDGQISKQAPNLASAFFATPDIEAGQRGSGLICEW
jgi:hypothetical protein